MGLYYNYKGVKQTTNRTCSLFDEYDLFDEYEKKVKFNEQIEKELGLENGYEALDAKYLVLTLDKYYDLISEDMQKQLWAGVATRTVIPTYTISDIESVTVTIIDNDAK